MDFQEFIEKERTRIGKLKDDALKRRKEIDIELAGYDKELGAILAYENAKTGKKATATRASRTGGRRDNLLQLITANPSGLNRGEILEKLGLKGDKSGEQSISNALSNLKKQGKIDSHDGKYVTA